MKTILVPTDFSECSINAAYYALNLAKIFNSSITLLNAYHVPTVGASYSLKGLNEELKKDSNSQLENIKKKFNNDFKNIEINTRSSFGLGVTEILDELYRKEYDLIVMGTTGASGIKGVLLGSTTSAIIGSTKTPIMAVPLNVEYVTPKIFSLASDLKKINSPNNIDFLASLATKLNSKINIIKVLDNNTDDKSNNEETQIKILDIDEALKGLKHEFQIIETDNIEAELLKRTKNIDNILTIIHKKRSFFEGIFHKSLSKKLAMHTKSPLLILQD